MNGAPETATSARWRAVEASHARGAFEEAAAGCRELLEADPGFGPAAEYLAARAAEAGRMDEAAGHLAQAVASGAHEARTLYALAGAAHGAGDWRQAAAAYHTLLRARPDDALVLLFLAIALGASGQEQAAARAYSLGSDLGGDLYHTLFEDQATPADLRQRILEADRRLRQTLTELHAEAVAEVAEAHPGEDLSRIRQAVWVQTHPEPVAFRHPQQRPWSFYVPGLEARPFFEREEFDWVDELERHYPEIRAEVESSLDIDADTLPYLRGAVTGAGEVDHLRDSRAWTSLHLYADAKENSDLRPRFPATFAALERVPVVAVNGTPVEAFFSVLQPGAHITPHFGLANCRVTAHLPLIVPDHCGLRAGDETRHWQEGRCFIFDDSFDHEAWNRSESVRIVLIFEVWHPDLRPPEQAAIEASFARRQQWLDSRRRAVLDAVA